MSLQFKNKWDWDRFWDCHMITRHLIARPPTINQGKQLFILFLQNQIREASPLIQWFPNLFCLGTLYKFLQIKEP